MARFRPLAEIIKPLQTTHTTGLGLNKWQPKALIEKENDNFQTIKPLKPHFNSSDRETGGGEAVATGAISRARLQKASHDLPVNMAVLVAEFANDEQDIAQGSFDDETLIKAVFTFAVYHMGLQPAPASTPADDGMVKCCQCGYWWNRCRHPDKFKGRWPELHPDRWRRCGEYQHKT